MCRNPSSTAATSPSQPCVLASRSRSARLAWISSSRGSWAGSTRSSGHLTHAFSCWQGVPWSRPQIPRATFRSSKFLAGPLGADHLRRALEFTEYSQDPKFGCAVRNNCGRALLHLGRLEEAQAAFTESLAMARAARDYIHICAANHNLAEISLRRNDPVSAQRHAREQLSVAERIEDPLQQAGAMDMLGSALCHHAWNRLAFTGNARCPGTKK